MSRKTTAQNTTAQKEEIKTINAMDYQETDFCSDLTFGIVYIKLKIRQHFIGWWTTSDIFFNRCLSSPKKSASLVLPSGHGIRLRNHVSINLIRKLITKRKISSNFR